MNQIGFPNVRRLLWDPRRSKDSQEIILSPKTFLPNLEIMALELNKLYNKRSKFSRIFYLDCFYIEDENKLFLGVDYSHTLKNVIKLKVTQTPSEKYLKFSDKERDLLVKEIRSKYCYDGKSVCQKSHFFMISLKFYIHKSERQLSVNSEILVPCLNFHVHRIIDQEVYKSELYKFLLKTKLTTNVCKNVLPSGYLTMNRNRKILLCLQDDKFTYQVPIIGIWVKGLREIKSLDLMVQMIRYFHVKNFKEKIFLPNNKFLLLIIPPIVTRQECPKFYSIEIKNNLGKTTTQKSQSNNLNKVNTANLNSSSSSNNNVRYAVYNVRGIVNMKNEFADPLLMRFKKFNKNQTFNTIKFKFDSLSPSLPSPTITIKKNQKKKLVVASSVNFIKVNKKREEKKRVVKFEERSGGQKVFVSKSMPHEKLQKRFKKKKINENMKFQDYTYVDDELDNDGNVIYDLKEEEEKMKSTSTTINTHDHIKEGGGGGREGNDKKRRGKNIDEKKKSINKPGGDDGFKKYSIYPFYYQIDRTSSTAPHSRSQNQQQQQQVMENKMLVPYLIENQKILSGKIDQLVKTIGNLEGELKNNNLKVRKLQESLQLNNKKYLEDLNSINKKIDDSGKENLEELKKYIFNLIIRGNSKNVQEEEKEKEKLQLGKKETMKNVFVNASDVSSSSGFSQMSRSSSQRGQGSPLGGSPNSPKDKDNEIKPLIRQNSINSPKKKQVDSHHYNLGYFKTSKHFENNLDVDKSDISTSNSSKMDKRISKELKSSPSYSLKPPLYETTTIGNTDKKSLRNKVKEKEKPIKKPNHRHKLSSFNTLTNNSLLNDDSVNEIPSNFSGLGNILHGESSSLFTDSNISQSTKDFLQKYNLNDFETAHNSSNLSSALNFPGSTTGGGGSTDKSLYMFNRMSSEKSYTMIN